LGNACYNSIQNLLLLRRSSKYSVTIIFKECILLCYSIKLPSKLFLSQHNNHQNSHTLHNAIMSLLVLWYYITLHVSAPRAIIRQYNLTNIFKLFNCLLCMAFKLLNWALYMGFKLLNYSIYMILELLNCVLYIKRAILQGKLKLEAICSSETSAHTRSTRRYIPEDDILHSHRYENLISYTILKIISNAIILPSLLDGCDTSYGILKEEHTLTVFRSESC
jgi:hypothetical protein